MWKDFDVLFCSKRRKYNSQEYETKEFCRKMFEKKNDVNDPLCVK